jgi:hypothetical protein
MTLRARDGERHPDPYAWVRVRMTLRARDGERQSASTGT